MKSSIKKICWLAVLICLLLSIFLVAPEMEEARRFFSAFAWVLFLFLITASLFPKCPGWIGWRCITRICIVVLLAPLAVALIFAIGDALTAYFSSIISQTFKMINNTYDEILLLCKVKVGKPFYAVITLAMGISLVHMLLSALWYGLPTIFSSRKE